MLDSLRIQSRATDLIATNAEFLEAAWSSAAFGAMAPIDFSGAASGQGYLTLEELEEQCARSGREWRKLDPFATEFEEEAVAGEFAPIPLYRGNTESLIADLRKWRAHDFLTIFLAGGAGTVDRFAQLFGDAGFPISVRAGIDSQLTRDLLYLSVGEIAHGFVSERHKTVVITEQDLSGQRTSSKDQQRMPSRRKKAIDPLELRAGDYIVHEQHGVGRYLELTKRTVGGVVREYVVIEYAPSKRGQPGDRIYVPTDALEQVTKYVGGEAPSLHRIGGADWQNAKKKARKAVRQIAADLIKLYAARMAAPGFAFSPDTPWQRELEDAFAYVETADQLSTIEEVKNDMQARHPMDRVICGDVGYGKTEIAIRAAFKAVQDGKQVAVLVPTTLLVQQHLNTFENRYLGFPIKVAGISRFNTAKENKEILEALARGELDVIIGTHRLLSKDVVFKDLGLVIIDEEQRFGVEHKEELKKTRANIDVLSMSATPIPRTLEMAITGIREMSNITTPPEERHPVLTYVGPFDQKQVQAAIHRELLRDGQIFYVHNRVESIDRVAIGLKEMVPQARVAVAHGQMSERELEDVILGFWEKDFDILVATTIIESGIDIPNANTLIVDRADVFGLSQLHQLRGRVGRARERAYAYFLYPGDKPLTEVAHDRLQTIATNTDLGAGMQVALKDLEIRGAGNMLGGEQSGHIADVGFDLYMRMVGEAVAEFKTGIVPDDGEHEDSTSIKVELPITAHLPEDYVDSGRLRLDLYRRLAEAASDDEVEALGAELLDRFGPLPQPAALLLQVAKLRIFAKSLKLREVIWMGKNLKLSPAKLPESMQIRLGRVYPGSTYKPGTGQLLVAINSATSLTPGSATADLGQKDGELLAWTHQVIRDLFVR